MSDLKIKLYHYWRSSCSWRVRWSLFFKGIPFDAVAVDLLKSEQKQRGYLSKNPSAYVPCLNFRDEYFSESYAILEWLEEKFPSPRLLPQDINLRLKIREFCLKIVSGTQPLQNLVVMRHHDEDKGEQNIWSKHWIERGLLSCESLLPDLEQCFCFGEDLSLADLCLVPQIYNAKRFNIDVSLFPKLKKIHDNCLKLDSCKKSHPDSFKP